MTAEDLALYEAGLATLAEFWGVENPPDYDVVRWVAPEDADAARVPCVLEAGFEFDGVAYSWPEGQRDAWSEAMYACAARYPILPRYTAAWTDTQLNAQYDWTIERVIPCLEEHGYSVGTPPSRTVFIDSWGTNPFFPFAQLPASADVPLLEQECPQQAPGAVLFDGMDPADWTR